MQMFQVYAPVFVLAGGLAYLLVVTLQQPPSQHLLHHRPSDTPHAATLFNHHPDPDANHGADPTAVAREQRRAPDTSFTVDESFTFPEVVPQGGSHPFLRGSPRRALRRAAEERYSRRTCEEETKCCEVQPPPLCPPAPACPLLCRRAR